MDYQEINAKTIDSWVSEGWEWGRPVSKEEFDRAKTGEWGVKLTPTHTVPKDWFGSLKGRKLLGLACGGAQQMPIFAALGADCTVVDYSPKQLESERLFAEKEGYRIDIIRADMTKPLPFENESFDIIFHPVSDCYIREIGPMLSECFRILKKGGRLLTGQDSGMNFIVDENDESRITHGLPYDPIAEPGLYKKDDGYQFSHTAIEHLKALISAGFMIKDAYEDTNGSGFLHEMGIPTFAAYLAVK